MLLTLKAISSISQTPKNVADINHQVRTLHESITVKSTPAAAWTVLADFSGVTLWAPGIRTATVVSEQKTGVGARRNLLLNLGFRIEEVITEWNEGSGYSFALVRAPYPMLDVHETIYILAEGDHVQVHSIVNYATKMGVVGTLLDRGVIHRLVKREMRASLTGLKRILERKSGGDSAVNHVLQSTN